MAGSGEGKLSLLVGLHVDRATADDVQEEDGPLGGLLGAALDRVEHASHLQDKIKQSAFFKKPKSFLLDLCVTVTERLQLREPELQNSSLQH